MKFVCGEGFNDEHYKLTELNKIPIKVTNFRGFVNMPDRIGKKITNVDFSKIRAIFIDIDPSKENKTIMKGSKNYDFKDWNQIVQKEIERIIEVFKSHYGKEPTYIFNSGAGIQIILEFDKPKAKKNMKEKDMLHYGFIFRFLELHLSDNFEMDDAIYNLSDQTTFWTRIAPRKCKIPTFQKVVKYKDEFKKKGKIYTNKIFYIAGNDKSTFSLNKMVVKDYDYLLATIYKYQIALLPKSRLEAIADISRVLLESGARHTGNKVNKIRCLLPSHPDNTPSAVFFQESGVYFCSACNTSLQLNEVYYLATGEDLNLSDQKIKFLDLPQYLTKYSKTEVGLLYFFKTPKSEFTISISEWKENDLIRILSQNFILGFKTKDRVVVLDNLTIRCDNREVPLVNIEKKGFYKDRIVISDKFSYSKKKYPETIKGERVWVERFGIMMNTTVEDGLECNHALDDKDINLAYSTMARINNIEFNANIFALIFSCLVMEEFEEIYGLSPMFYVHGFRDTGKTSLVEFALSLITTNTQTLEPGISSLYTLLMSLEGKDYMPVLLDEAAKFLDDKNKTIVQVLKDISVNGGNYIKGKPGGLIKYSLKATPILVNEFRIDTLDPSFFQRCIEIDLNIYDKINLNNAGMFNILMKKDKTKILLEMIRFLEKYKVDFMEVENFLETQITHKPSLTEGKKRFSMTLYSTGLLLAYNFMMEKKAYFKKGSPPIPLTIKDAIKHINKYGKSEIEANSKKHRKVNLAEQIIQFLELNAKFKADAIVNRMTIVKGNKDVVIGYFSAKMLIAIGWRNQHLLGELRVSTTSPRALNGKQFRSTLEVEFNKDDAMSLLELLAYHSSSEVVKNKAGYIIRNISGNNSLPLDEEEEDGIY